jgi:hypothetical protein
MLSDSIRMRVAGSLVVGMAVFLIKTARMV